MIDMKYGRKDAVKPEDCVDEGNLPAGNKPFPDADNAQVRWCCFFRPTAVTVSVILGRPRRRADPAQHRGRVILVGDG